MKRVIAVLSLIFGFENAACFFYVRSMWGMPGIMKGLTVVKTTSHSSPFVGDVLCQ